MRIWVVAFNGSSGSPIVEYAATTREACCDYLKGKIVPDGMGQFIRQVTLHGDSGEPVSGVRVDD
jgi:hypothetical protein